MKKAGAGVMLYCRRHFLCYPTNKGEKSRLLFTKLSDAHYIKTQTEHREQNDSIPNVDHDDRGMKKLFKKYQSLYTWCIKLFFFFFMVAYFDIEIMG